MIGRLSGFLIVYLIVMSSCGNKELVTTPIIHTKIYQPNIVKCPKPERPIFEKLDEDKPLTSEDNLAKLLGNISGLKWYCKSLEETIKCYEEQIMKIENQLNKQKEDFKDER